MWLSTRLVLTMALMVQNSIFSPEARTASASAADSPVITVHGVCPGGPSSATEAQPCVTRISRRQFENLMSALSTGGPPLSPSALRALAKSYAEYLAVEAAARDSGLEETPQFRELMNWSRVRATTELYRRNLQQKYKNPPAEEIDAYYREHHAEYETIRLIRILVPRENGAAGAASDFDARARAAANLAQGRAVQGDDPAQIQKDVYLSLALASPPPVDLGERRRTELIPQEAGEIFSLKPGEVSQVQTEPKSYVIYKVLSKDVLGLEKVRAGIADEIYEQKFRKSMKTLVDGIHADFDEQYFGAAKAGGDKTGRP